MSVISIRPPCWRPSGCVWQSWPLWRPAAGSLLDGAIGRASTQHSGDLGVALGVLGAADVLALCFGLCLALYLAAATVFVILAGDGSQHVEQHAIDRFEHPRCEVVDLTRRHGPAGRQIERDDADLAGCPLCLETIPVGGAETRKGGRRARSTGRRRDAHRRVGGTTPALPGWRRTHFRRTKRRSACRDRRRRPRPARVRGWRPIRPSRL